MEFERGLATRTAYGEVLAELGEKNEDIVVLDGDLSKSTRTYMFAEKFPDRFYNVGIQEGNMVGLAAGLASAGMVPFVSSFACFLTARAFDQMRVSVAYAELPVKFVASHGGISGGEDGVTQQSIEDLALMASLPEVSVCVPADEHATRSLVPQLLDRPTPCYLRTGRPQAPVVYEPGVDMTLGEARVLREGEDVTVVAQGLLLAEALKAAADLSDAGIEAEVIDVHTMKPFDRETVASSARKTGRVVVAEEHQIWGGLSSTVARELSTCCPVPMEFVAIEDTYAESGPGYELLEKYGLTASAISAAANTVLEK